MRRLSTPSHHLTLPIAVLVIALVGCASSRAGSTLPRGEATPTETGFIGDSWDAELELQWEERARAYRILPPIDAAWAVLPDVYEALGIQGGVAGDRILRFGPAPVRRIGGGSLSNFVDCGYGPGGPYAVLYDVTLEVVTHARATSDGTASVLETLVRGTAADRASRTRPIRWTSTGDLERLIAEVVAGHVLDDTATATPGR